jgi:hypothetical protein
MDSLTVIGTPFATVVDVPKLERISLRATPLALRTLAPFEPSPGYGPAVSVGMTSQTADVDAEEAVVAAAATDVAVVSALALAAPAVVAVDPVLVALEEAHPTRPTRATVPINLRALRRSISVERSKAKPRSWSCSSSVIVTPFVEAIKRPVGEPHCRNGASTTSL